MKLTLQALACFALLISASAQATIYQISWSGLTYETTDSVGNVYDNGVGSNTGVGTEVRGDFFWTDPYFNRGTHGAVALYDLDFNGSTSYHVAERDQFVSNFVLGNEQFTSELNLGAYYSILLTDGESGVSPTDSYSFWSYNTGYYQVGPEIGMLSDHVEVRTNLYFGIENLMGGTLIKGLDPVQLIDWTYSPDDPTTAFGSASVQSRYWEDGTSQRGTGTPGVFLQQASARFMLTSFKATAVPEPSTVCLLSIGLLAVALTRRRRLKLSAV